MKKFLSLLAGVVAIILIHVASNHFKEESRQEEWSEKVAWCKRPVNESITPSAPAIRNAWLRSESVLQAVYRGKRNPSSQARDNIKNQLSILKWQLQAVRKAEISTLADLRFEWNMYCNLEAAFNAATYMRSEDASWRDLYETLESFSGATREMNEWTFNSEQRSTLLDRLKLEE